jgi:hypothetical protein
MKGEAQKLPQSAIRPLERDVFGPVQINGIKNVKQFGVLSRREGIDGNIKELALGSPDSKPNNSAMVKPELITNKAADIVEAKPQLSPSRFGTLAACPGCQTGVSPMERGVVPGPQGTRWHAMCLVCGGKRSNNKEEEQQGCGKKLDSSAKTDKVGRLFCRNCLVS